MSHDSAKPRPAALPSAIVLGVGLGGFIDGIVLHQMLQWHHMLTNEGRYPDTTIRGLEVNTLWDGLFHASTWIFVMVGLLLLWRAVNSGTRFAGSWNTLIGGLLTGWGLFNLVEGIIDHHILGIHHVRTDVSNTLPWDLGFLALGAALLIGGYVMASRDRSVIDVRHLPAEQPEEVAVDSGP